MGRIQIHKIIQGCLNNDRKSQKALYEKVAPLMLAVSHRYANNKADAEDIFQESVLNVFSRIHQLREVEKINGWVKQIVVHEAIRFYKKKRNLVFTDDIFPEQRKTNNAPEVYKQIEMEQLTKVIQQLPDKMRMVINLYAIEGYKHEEIADLLGISVGTSKSNLHDARKKIKISIKEEERRLG